MTTRSKHPLGRMDTEEMSRAFAAAGAAMLKALHAAGSPAQDQPPAVGDAGQALQQRRSRRRTLKDRLRRIGGLACLGTLLLTGCANQGGLLGSGLYKTRMGGPMARVGMTSTQVEYIMGPSWDTVIAGRGELWRYGYNILGLVGPTCNVGSRGGAIGCIDVYFYEGVVSNVITY